MTASVTLPAKYVVKGRGRAMRRGIGSRIHVRLPTLHTTQRQVVTERSRFNVLECGRRWGKDILGEDRALRPAVRKGLPVGWFAPTYKYLMESWRHIIDRLGGRVEDGGMISDISPLERRLELVNGGIIKFWTMDNPDAGRGDDYARVVINEAGLVRELDERWEAAIRPTISMLHGDAWFLGTPKGRRFFHQLYEKGQSHMQDPDGGLWASWRFGSVHNPKMDPEELAIAERDMPPEVYKQEYLGEPAEDGGNPFGMAAIKACTSPLHKAQANIPFLLPRERGHTYSAGVDLARAEDYTVDLTLDNDSGLCVALDRFHLPWELTEPRVVQLLKDYNARYEIDATGAGDKVSNDIIKATGTVAQGRRFEFTAPSKQALMTRLMVAFHKKEFLIPQGWLVAEVESFGYEYHEHGVRYSAPAGLHDDGVIALALAVRARDTFGGVPLKSSQFRTIRK